MLNCSKKLIWEENTLEQEGKVGDFGSRNFHENILFHLTLNR